MYLEIRNFGQHEHLTLDVERSEVMFVVGKNRVGKTTIRDAIEFALLGTNEIRGFRTRKDVAAYMIRRVDGKPASKCEVTFRWGDKGVQRAMTSKGGHKISVFRNGVYIEANAAEYAEYLGKAAADKGVALRVALDCDTFYRLGEEERRKLLISVKDSEGLDAGDVWEALGAALTTYAEEDDARLGQLRGVCETAALLSFAKADEQAVEFRREAKRALADIEGKLERDPLVPEIDGIDATRGTPEEQRERLGGLRAELEQAIAARAAGGRGIEGKLEEANRQLDKAKETLEGIGPVQMAIGDGLEPIALLDLRTMKGTVSEIAQEARDEVREAAETLEALEADLEEVERRIAATQEPPEHPGLCPAVDFQMKCRVKPETFEKAFREAGGGPEAGAGLEKRRVELLAEIEPARAEKDSLLARAAGATSKAEQVGNALAECEKLAFRWQTAKEAVDEIETRIAELEREAQDVPQDIPSDEDVLKLRDRISVGEKVVAHRAAFDEDKRNREKLETEKAAISLTADWWDEVEKLLRPDGIERALADLGKSAFSESLETADALAQVRIEESMEISINGRHIASCSESEALCGGIALQAAMARHLGLGFLAVDRVDKLDLGWKRQFQSWAGDARESWQSGALVLATSDADPPGTPPDGFRTTWLREGERPLVLGGGME